MEQEPKPLWPMDEYEGKDIYIVHPEPKPPTKEEPKETVIEYPLD